MDNALIIAIDEVSKLEQEIQETNKVIPEGLPYELWLIGKNKALEAVRLTKELLILGL